ncbi:MAG: type II CRISPR RNA-guided endonuclease Cas9 [Pseudomonadota bacterium]|nr:type II CRISPR RNA-guided endonuclease Cas9 [Pseudomonadota bacterium]
MQKRVLGIDLGIASLGWAVIDLDEEIQEKADNKNSKYKTNGGKIVQLGVRTFDEPVDRQGKSKAAIRGEARRNRATIERKAERLKYFIKLAKQYNIISDSFTVKELEVPKGISFQDWELWKLRAKAVNEKISYAEIFRVLYHIANHRGFYFPTKAEMAGLEDPKTIKNAEDDEQAKEDKKIKGGISAMRCSYAASGYKTIGEYIFHKEGRKRNKKDDYSVSLYRTDLCDEVRSIFDFQRRQGNSLLTSEFEKHYIDEVLMYTHPLDDDTVRRMIGECELICGELRFPKQGYEAELFTFYNRINNLKILDKDKNEYEFDREKILDLILNTKNCKISFSDLRQFLNLNNGQKFNLCSYHEYNPEYQKTIKIERNKINEFNSDNLSLYDTQTGEILDSCWKDLKQKAEQYFNKYDQAKSVSYYYSDVRKQLDIPENKRFLKLKKDYCLSQSEIGIDKYLAQFEKETFVEFSGYWLLKKELGDNFKSLSKDTLNDIAEALAYCKTDESRQLYLQQHGICDETFINKILELNMKEVSSFSRKALCALNEKMKEGMLFNDAKEELGYNSEENIKTTKIKEYHGAFEKNASVARMIAEFRKTVNAINKKYGPIDEIHIELATEVANSKDKIIRIKNGQKRYKEQRDAARERCQEHNINPDEGDNLLRFRLAEEQDFKCIYTNKQIWLGKKENTPEDWISIFECDIDHIIPISRSFNDSLANKVICSNSANREKTNHLPHEWFKDTKTDEEWQIFKTRVLSGNKMSGAKKHNLLREKFDEEDMKGFISRDLNNTRYATRHIAEYLRKYFSFEQSENRNIKDINRIRVLGGGITAKLRHLWGLEKNRDESNLHHALDAAVIACASFSNIYYICSILKDLEIKGIRPKKTQLAPWETFREDLLSSLNEITVSKQIRASTTGQAHKQPDKKKKGYTLIKRQNAKNVIDVTLDSMFRYDIYRNDKGYYCMPIYAIDLHRRDFKYETMQDKTKIEALEQDFVFSLYKGSMVKIITKEDECFDGYVSQFNAQSGQFYLESINGDYHYEINTSTFKIGDYMRIESEDYCISEYEAGKKQLKLVPIVGNNEMYIDAEMKTKEKSGESQNVDSYKTNKTYIKLDKEKKISLANVKDFQKFSVDRLGAVTRVKKETERFSQKMKSNKQRAEDRKQRKNQRS